MSQKRLNLAALIEIDDGRINQAVNIELTKLVHDIYDRGADGGKRSLIIEIGLTPIVSGGNVDDVDVEVELASKAPKRRSKTYRMQQKGGQALVFNPHAPEEPRQRTIDERAGGGGGGGEGDDED